MSVLFDCLPRTISFSNSQNTSSRHLFFFFSLVGSITETVTYATINSACGAVLRPSAARVEGPLWRPTRTLCVCVSCSYQTTSAALGHGNPVGLRRPKRKLLIMCRREGPGRRVFARYVIVRLRVRVVWRNGGSIGAEAREGPRPQSTRQERKQRVRERHSKEGRKQERSQYLNGTRGSPRLFQWLCRYLPPSSSQESSNTVHQEPKCWLTLCLLLIFRVA